MSDEKFSFSQYLPYAGAGLVFLGVIRLVFYYSWFGIDILNYLEFSEIITSFLDKIIFLAFLVLYSIVAIFFIEINKYEDSQSTFHRPSLKVLVKIPNLVGRIKESIKGSLSLLGSVLVVSVLTGIYFWSSLRFFAILPACIMFAFFCVSLIAQREIFVLQVKRFPNKSDISTPLLLIYGFFFLIFITLSAAFLEVNSVKFKKVNKNVRVQLDTLSLKSNREFYYVGKTNSFIFFYNDSTDRAEIYPMNRVRKIETDHRTVN